MAGEKEQSKTIKMPLRIRYKRRIKVLLILLGLLLIAGAGYLWIWPLVNVKPACSDEVIKQASVLLDRPHKEQLKPIADNTQKLKNFKKDPNCLYIVTTYYINVEDPTNARRFFESLKKVYNPQKGLSPKFGDIVKSLAGIELEVEFVEKVVQEREHDVRSVPNTE